VQRSGGNQPVLLAEPRQQERLADTSSPTSPLSPSSSFFTTCFSSCLPCSWASGAPFTVRTPSAPLGSAGGIKRLSRGASAVDGRFCVFHLFAI